MYKACQDSVLSIDFEQYILKDDEAGMRFLELFRDKARAGIKVRLILDRIGSRILYASKIIGEIAEAGGRVHFYNKLTFLNLFAPKTWFPRNHIKLMLVDGETAFVGSVCVSADMADWRDLHARVTGGLVSEIESYFNHIWEKKRHPWQDPGKAAAKHSDFRFLAAFAQLQKNMIYKEIRDRIRAAQDHVHIVTPYFLPPFLLRRALYAAARRGVDVTVMMNTQSDSWIADYVSQSYFCKFLNYGLKIILYPPGEILHAKYTIIDGDWATLGSTNMDYLSLRRNREANIVMRHTGTIKKLQDQFDSDAARCNIADMAFCKSRPLHVKVIGRLGRFMKRML